MTTTGSATPFRFVREDGSVTEWVRSQGLVAYPDAVSAMETRAAAIADGSARELVWLLEHPPLYTAGVSAKPADLLSPDRLPVYSSGRGGQFTYHGPGQRVAYVMLDLSARRRDARAFVDALATWIISALSLLGVAAETRPGRVGVWVVRETEPGRLREDKIGAIGVKLRRWVSFHGVSLNVETDLSRFDGIVPCGISEYGVTSLRRLGHNTSMAEVDAALATAFQGVFGPISWSGRAPTTCV